MRRSALGLWLLAGVTLLAISAWSGSARTGVAGSAEAANDVEWIALPAAPPVVPPDDVVTPGSGFVGTIPPAIPRVVPDEGGVVGNPMPPIAPVPNPNGDASYGESLPVQPVPIFGDSLDTATDVFPLGFVPSIP